MASKMMRRLVDLAYAGYLTGFLPAAIFALAFVLGTDLATLATLMEFFTIVLFPLGILFLLAGLAGPIAAIVVVRHDWRPLALWGISWFGTGLFGAVTENSKSLPPWVVALGQALLLALCGAATAYFARHWRVERKRAAAEASSGAAENAG